AAAAEAMRRVLIERARQHRAEKRGGARERVTLSGHDVAAEGDRDLDLLALDDALRKLEATDPRLAKVVSMRFFAQLGVEEVATALGVSPRTVKREWAFAKAWLYRELHGNDS
ncbi:MAG: RNA polymerase subunit sigma, partial [Planctomycetes bacterium]|nr:RNA polymerase subunit sigma [Planctomycetota bacterium]